MSSIHSVTMFSLFLFISHFPLIFTVFHEAGCKYTFHVWQPDQDILTQMSQLRFKFDNFSGHTNYDLSRMKLDILNDLHRFQNSTSNLEKEMVRIRIATDQSKIRYEDLDSEISSVRRELDLTSRKIDDLEMDYFKLANQNGNPVTHYSNGRIAISNRDKNLIGVLKNSVGDLKAEWLLVKRELDDIRRDNVELKQGQSGLRNDTLKLKQTVRSIVSTLQTGVPLHKTAIADPSGRISGLSNDIASIQESQEDLKYETLELRNEISTLQNSNIRFENNIHELQVENVRLKEYLESIGKEERTGRGVEIVRTSPETNDPSSAGFIHQDCHELYQTGSRTSGVYNIQPSEAPLMVSVYCEMVNKTGFTLIQRRVDGLLSFNRRWLEYRYGFGNPYGEFWFGNDLIHLMSKQKQYILRVDLWDWEGNKAYAEYDSFYVEDGINQYRLHVSGYSGDAGDSMSYHDNMAFSTEDVDNDLHTRHCAAENKGGWWFNSCYSSALNGIYHTAWYSQARSNYADGTVWFTWKDSEFYSLKKVEMKLRPKVP